MPEQLTFDLPVRTSRDRGDFFVSDANAMSVARLEDTGGWPRAKLALVGPEGAGKTHLAHVWAETSGAEVIGLGSLVGRDVTKVGTGMAIDVPDAPMSAAEEEALFHLHNHMGAHALPLLMVAREAPARWEIALPDLKSRMAATDVVEIDEPDDALLSAVLLKLFADRQLQVPPSLIGWMVPRIDRSFRSAQEAVTALDKAALAEKRAITMRFAGEVLDNLGSKAR